MRANLAATRDVVSSLTRPLLLQHALRHRVTATRVRDSVSPDAQVPGAVSEPKSPDSRADDRAASTPSDDEGRVHPTLRIMNRHRSEQRDSGASLSPDRELSPEPKDASANSH